jgi:hypothetical protein
MKASIRTKGGLIIAIIVVGSLSLIDTSTNLRSNDFGSTPSEGSLAHDQPKNVSVEQALSGTMALHSSILGDIPVVLNSSGSYQDGYNAFVLSRQNISAGTKDNALLVVDMQGNIVAEKAMQNNFGIFAIPVEWINSTTLLYGNETGQILWNFYTNRTQMTGEYAHHDFEFNHINNTVFVITLYGKFVGDNWTIFDKIIEYDLQGNQIWSFDTANIASIDQYCPYHDISGPGNIDLTHTNTVFFNSDDDTLIVNLRNTNTFYKIDHKTGQVLWGLGEYGNFAMYDIHGNRKDSLFYHAHGVQQIDDNTFIIFDNDFHNETKVNDMTSRIVEITVNMDTMTANESWVWSSPTDYYTAYWGNAERLPNGDRFATFGSLTHPSTNLGARLVEVNDSGNIVWELAFQNEGVIDYGVYQAQRFAFAPILSHPEDQELLANQNISITWNAWYNFMPKRTVNGTYDLFIDGSLNTSGEVRFDRFWRPTELAFSLSPLGVGTHNVTLVVYDEGMHYSTDSVEIDLKTSFIVRTGLTEYEFNPNRSFVIVWSGETIAPLWCNITLDNVLESEFEWDGTDISLNTTSLAPGMHEISLHMYAGISLVQNDTFSMVIFESAAPVVDPLLPSMVTLQWNWSISLPWLIMDNSSVSWMILDSGRVVGSGSVAQGNNTLNCAFPLTVLGLVNCTLVATDANGLSTSTGITLNITAPSLPVFMQVPQETESEWGAKNTTMHWYVIGCTSWTLYRNGTVISSGTTTFGAIDYAIDWQGQHWRLGSYNITLALTNGQEEVSHTQLIEVGIDFGDPYADAVVPIASAWYSFGSYALGPPDGKYANIFVDYGNGYLTLDMGENEDVLDGPGYDFEVYATGGTYSISVGSSVDSYFTSLGSTSGRQSFNLSQWGLSSFRYIRIGYISGDTVQLDAIVGIHVASIGADTEPPEIASLDNIQVWSNQTSVVLDWSASDLTPWNYSILVNGSLLQSGPWYGDDVSFTFQITTAGVFQVSLMLFDLFNQMSVDEVTITVNSLSSTPTTNSSTIGLPPVIAGPPWLVLIAIALIAVALVVIPLLARSKYSLSKP